MTKALFLVDSYLKESPATVVSVKDEKYIILDQTLFYPKGGGQPHDTGKIIKGREIYNVVYVGKFLGEISHEVDNSGLKAGDKVYCMLNWKRRYKLMRSHTAAHVLAFLLHKGTGALITGNQLEEDHVRFDFSLKKFDKSLLEAYLVKANKLYKANIPVKWYELPREEAMKIPGIVKMASAFPPNLPTLRIVEIVGIDRQADGGTHVRNLREIEEVKLVKTVNKGKNNRRIYFKLN
ncbi:MAG: alanyl-tRNA editing protein AlaXM [Candidatus Bathyarchaeota archaeon]|jgi:misacylated tRNA(Ala) deacylase|nr:alanyl-tRNA editing protein AlaXM [Candidatus Bathyarchaeota archaeon]